MLRKRRRPYAKVILDSWTLQDVCLFLNRDSLDTLSLTARVFQRAVGRMPVDTCLRALDTLELRLNKPKWSERSMEAGLLSACFRHFLDHLKRLAGPYRVLSRLAEYTYSPRSRNPVYVERHKRFWRLERAVELIRAELRHSCVSVLEMRLPNVFTAVGALRAHAEPRGVVDILRISGNAVDVDISAFENLPLSFPSVRRLHLTGCFGLTAGHQSDRFLRNCIASGVRQIRMNPSGDKSDSGLSDISEESLLEFCFGGLRHPKQDEGSFDDVYLNRISLSKDFLRRFIQASEACEADRKLMIFLCGGKLFPQDFSLFNLRDENYTAYREFCGRSRLVVGCNVDANFLFICRTLASWRWHDGEKFLPHHADFERGYADHWIWVSHY